MASRNFPATYGPALTYLGYWAESIALGVAVITGITESAASKLMADPTSLASANYAVHNEGFFDGLEDGVAVPFGPSMRDREALAPYVGILCGGDSL